MSKTLLQSVVVVVLLAAAFLAGRGSQWLAAQDGRGPKPQTPPSGPITVGPDKEPELLVYGESTGGSASANGVIAVTGSYGVGTSVLYVIDTNTKQMAVYEARGGSRSTRRLTLVGARRIDLDLQLEGYNDDSEFSYAALQRRFESLRAAPDAARAGDATGGSGRDR
jgi:hypothetical protein